MNQKCYIDMDGKRWLSIDHCQKDLKLADVDTAGISHISVDGKVYVDLSAVIEFYEKRLASPKNLKEKRVTDKQLRDIKADAMSPTLLEEDK